MGKNETDFREADHYCTPESVWGPITDYLGPIGLDPMTNHRSTVPAAVRWTDWELTAAQSRHYGLIQRDALMHDWSGYGTVFCNGPFSILIDWVRHASLQRVEHNSVLLVPVRTTGKAWQQYIFPFWNIVWLNFRVAYNGVSAPFHSALCHRGPGWTHLTRAFSGRATFQKATASWGPHG